jgi:outer membrane lipoprotein carrier protein LolA
MKALLSLLAACLLEGEEEARALLRALAKKQEGLATLSAGYLQTRTSALSRSPLTSRGTLHFRARPSCIVFEVAEPRPARIRLDETSYEVHRPAEKRLERFLLGSSGLSKALFQAFAADVEGIEGAFRIERFIESGEKKEAAEIELRPREEAMRRQLTSLTLTVAREGPALTRISYQDGQGDRVTIDLEKVVLNPKLAAETFDAPLPEGTKVIVHSVGAERGGR